MIGSTLIEQKAAELFLFLSIEAGLFANARETSIHKPRRMKIEKVVFIQPNEPIIWSQRPYKTGHI